MAQPVLSTTAKRVIAIGLFLSALWLAYSVRSVLPPFVMAAVLAYVLNPLVALLARLTRRSRTAVVALIYIALIIVLILMVVLIIPTLLHQIQAINIDLESIATQARQLLADYQHVEIAGFSVDLFAFSDEVTGALRSVATYLAARTGGIVVGVVSGFVWILLILLVSFHMLKDANNFQSTIHNMLPPAYQPDFNRLVDQINAVLSDYLRGQLLLGLVIGMVTATALAILGVRNALLLGVIAGVLELVPTIGPILAAVPSIASAFFQGSTTLDMENYWFALLILGLYVVIQQLENNILVPRIIGSSVNLHPIVVIFAALAGASLAGLLGVFLAIPVIATGRIIVVYLVHKLRE